MKKLAFYVEGQTEQLFVRSLVERCAGECSVRIVSQRGNLGKRHPRRYMEMGAKSIGTGDDFYVLIVDSGSDESVVSDVRSSFDNLVRENYSAVVALRDVRPSVKRQDIDKLVAGITRALAGLTEIPVECYLSIMEVEAWFLAENTHFIRLDAQLTEERITQELGFFPHNANVEHRDNPSSDLRKIYAIVGKEYDKSRDVVECVMNLLNFSDIIEVHATQIENLGGLVSEIKGFFEA